MQAAAAAAVFCITAFHFRFITKLSHPSEVLQVARVAALQLATLRRDFFCLSIYHLSVQASQHQPAGSHCLNLYLTTKTDNKQDTW